MTDNEEEKADELLRGAARLGARPEGACLDDELLLKYRRGLATPEEEEGAELHLASCASCRQLLAAMDVRVDDLAARRARGALIKRRSRWAGAAAAVIVLAIGASVATWSGDRERVAFAIEGPLGGIETVRGSGTNTDRFDGRSTFRLIARPDRPTQTKTEVHLFVAPIGGEERETQNFQQQTAPNGTVEITAPARVLFAAPGRYVVACVLRSGRDEQRSAFEAEYLEEQP